MARQTNWKALTDLGDIWVNLDIYYAKQQPQANGCIDSLLPRHAQGYTMIGAIRKTDNKRIMTVAHRVTARIKLGRAITSQDAVIHTCLSPACLNPDHITIGNLSLRNQVMIAKGHGNSVGRKKVAPRKQNRSYRWTDEEIIFGRNALNSEIAERFGIDEARAARLKHSLRRGYLWLKG
jgi:hypothetical protein